MKRRKFMIKIKAGVFANQRFIESYHKLANNDKLGAATMQVVRVTKKLIEEHEAFDKARGSIYKKYGKEDNGQFIIEYNKFTPDQLASFNSEMEALIEVEITLPIDEKIKISCECGLKPIEFILLDDFIEIVE